MAANNWLSLQDALKVIYQQSCPVTDLQECPVYEASGRILAHTLYAPMSVPGQDVSSMDGYALAAPPSVESDTFEVAATIFAGDDAGAVTLKQGQAARIMTGAGIPAAADRVVMQENTVLTDTSVKVTLWPDAGENIRSAGEDITSGDEVIKSGTRLKPEHLMLLSSLGITSITVYRKLNVALLATGDELKAPGDTLKPGQIYNSNSVGIAALLQPYHVNIIDLGIAADNQETLTRIFKEAIKNADVLISSGGVSVGDADFVKPTLQALGNIDFWKIAIKPGKPFAFGHLENCLFCGVPGNPVSAYVTTQQLVLPLIQKLQGEENRSEPLTITATLTQAIRHRPGRAEFVRAWISRDTTGNWKATPLSKQSSGVMTTVTKANAYILVAADSTGLSANDPVSVQPFSVCGDWSTFTQ